MAGCAGGGSSRPFPEWFSQRFRAARFVPQQVVPAMHAIFRRLTAALLLSSYLFATTATWLHTGHPCPDSGGSCGTTQCCSPCGDHDESADPPAQRVAGSDHWIVQSDESSGEHRHQSDECLLCRFLVIKKTAETPAGPAISSGVLPQPVALALPTWRVAELQATPDCRAPPDLA